MLVLVLVLIMDSPVACAPRNDGLEVGNGGDGRKWVMFVMIWKWDCNDEE